MRTNIVVKVHTEKDSGKMCIKFLAEVGLRLGCAVGAQFNLRDCWILGS